MSAFISISQALQEPVSTSRIVSDRLKSLVLSLASWTTGTAGASAPGYLPVTTPVFRLFLMIRNMFSFLVRREALGVRGFGTEVTSTCCHAPYTSRLTPYPSRSEIIPRVREVKALVDQRKIRNDIPQHCPLDRRPVHKRRVAHLTSMNLPLLAGHHHVHNFTTPAFDRRQGPFTGLWHATWHVGNRPLRNLHAHLPDQPHGFMNLIHADPHPRPHIAVAIRDHLDRQFIVGGKRSITTEVLIETRRPSDDSHYRMIPRRAFRQDAGGLQAVYQGGVGGDNRFQFREVLFDAVQFGDNLGQLHRREIHGDSAHPVHPAEKS